MVDSDGNNSVSLILTQIIWSELLENAKMAKRSKQMKAFMLLRPARAKPFNLMTELVEIPVRIVKEDSGSGSIFRWNYANKDRKRYYPAKKLTNRGTAIIQPKLDMTLHYAFWMGCEYGISGSGGFHLNLWMNDNEDPIYKAYYVNGKGTPCTDGEFWEIHIQIV